MLEPVIVVHGGAGDIKDSVVPSAIEKVKKAAEKGYKELIKSGNALDAVQAAVEFMEDEAQFNAGILKLFHWYVMWIQKVKC